MHWRTERYANKSNFINSFSAFMYRYTNSLRTFVCHIYSTVDYCGITIRQQDMACVHCRNLSYTPKCTVADIIFDKPLWVYLIAQLDNFSNMAFIVLFQMVSMEGDIHVTNRSAYYTVLMHCFIDLIYLITVVWQANITSCSWCDLIHAVYFHFARTLTM